MGTIKGSYFTDVGGRSENEDSFLLIHREDRGCCALVADGLGGHGGGAAASAKAKDIIEECFLSEEIKSPEEFNVWFQKANQEVINMQTPDIEMKTTLVVLIIKNKNAMWANIGDSRLYHFRNGELVEQTFDHSVSQMAVLRGEIKQEEIRGHIDRNRLLQAIGRTDTIKLDYSDRVSLDGAEHAFLLCTDGFWEYVTEAEMEKDLRKSDSPNEWLEKMKKRLEKRTRNIDNDNNTAVAIMYK
ncbi:MAG: protein phosphatase 2C domain-containing protein [Lachnospiraceae bacterium]|nr:protein phosphatase 2C domain-containing protein [Lachnospiraceae bacterium]